jgi:hypothetical protein
LCPALAWFWPERRLPRIVAVPAYLVIGNLAALRAGIAALRGADAGVGTDAPPGRATRMTTVSAVRSAF